MPSRLQLLASLLRLCFVFFALSRVWLLVSYSNTSAMPQSAGSSLVMMNSGASLMTVTSVPLARKPDSAGCFTRRLDLARPDIGVILHPCGILRKGCSQS